MNELDYNRRVYNEVAEAYQQKRQDPQQGAWNNFLEVPAIESLLKPVVKNKRVLDLGCGTGLLTQEIIKWGGDTCGIDPSEKMIELAKTHLPKVDFQVASATELPFSESEFDVVASSLVMHYLKDLRPAFNEVSRVLKPDGEFVFSMHHPVQESLKWDKTQADGVPVLQPYFNNDHYYWQMCGAKFLSFHHTFEDIIHGLSGSGFVVKDLIECRPPESSRNKFKDFYFTSNFPTFCVFRAVVTSCKTEKIGK